MKKLDFKNYKLVKEKSNLKGEWQEYAINLCQEFKIVPPYSFRIFCIAKKNLVYLKGKVALVRESDKFDELSKANALGRYLTTILKK